MAERHSPVMDKPAKQNLEEEELDGPVEDPAGQLSSVLMLRDKLSTRTTSTGRKTLRVSNYKVESS